MIKQFRVQNYKALRDVTLDLTPIHVLIGPNDSGKTSILDAIAAYCRSVDYQLAHAFTGMWEGRSLVWHAEQGPAVALGATVDTGKATFDYDLSCRFGPNGRSVRVEDEQVKVVSESEALEFTNKKGISNVNMIATQNIGANAEEQHAASLVHDAIGGVHTYRWNPRLLALPVAPDAKRRFRMEPSGFGLALCLDDILGYDRRRFADLEDRFREIFGHIKSIRLMPEPAYRCPPDQPQQIEMFQQADGKGLYFEFAGGGEDVSAAQVSDGVLLVLAYLTILSIPQPPRVVLIEEPENGIHPKRLQKVLEILRGFVKDQTHTQVILTTHSPYVVDLFEPDEVTLCQMEGDGSVSTHRLSESETVREQLKVFTLGEIWTAEGDEALGRKNATSQGADS